MSKLELLKNSIDQKCLLSVRLHGTEPCEIVCLTLLESDKTRDGRNYVGLSVVKHPKSGEHLFEPPMFVCTDDLDILSVLPSQPGLFLVAIASELSGISKDFLRQEP